MSNVARVAGQAANTLSKPLQVEDVFSTFLYEGNGGTQSINNGIDLDGEGGLVWFKARNDGGSTYHHALYDTERGVNKRLRSDDTSAEANDNNDLMSFNTNGFTLGGDARTNAGNSIDYVSWTFRKAPKFFDVVTYTGDNSGNVVKSHNLGSTPGMIIIKNLDSNTGWDVFHRSLTSGLGTGRVFLHNTNAEDNTSIQFLTADSSSITLTHSIVKTGGENYVAYLFAHNNNDGTFGPDGDADIIKCGSYTGNGSSNGPEIDLGFEPQWVMIKGTQYGDATGGDYRHWYMYDMMRGNTVHDGSTYDSKTIKANESDNESGTNYNPQPTPTGFKLGANRAATNYNGETYIYIAIRRPTAVPTSATEVFNIKTSVNTNPAFTSDHVIDLAMFTHKTTSDNRYWSARLASRGYLYSNATNAEATNQAAFDFGDTQFGHYNSTGLGTNYLGYFWKRAPNFCDVLAYTGNGTLGHTISHNLGVAPEMMWIKVRSEAESWRVYHYGLPTPEDDFLKLDTTEAVATTVEQWNSTAPTATEFSVSGQGRSTNDSGEAYIAYLFASLAGISKVGSVTHSGTTNVDCGFSSGASLVMLKRTDSTGDWYWWDSTSGIVSGNDPYFILNGQAAQVTNTDYIDPLSSGFTITSSLTAGDYIFYAIA